MSSPGHHTYAAALEALHADLTSDEGDVRSRAGVEAASLLEWRRRRPLSVEERDFEFLIRPSLRVRPPTDEDADQLVEHLHAEMLRIVGRGGVRPGTPALLFALQKGLRASSRAALIDIVLHHSDELDADELATALDALNRHLELEQASSDWSSELGSFDTWRGVLAGIAARHPGVEALVQDAWSIDAHVGTLLAPAGSRESMRFTMRQLRQHMIGSPEELRAAVVAARLPIMQTVLVLLDDSEDGMRGLVLADRVSTFSFMYRWNEEGDLIEFRWVKLDEDEADPRALEIGRSILDLEADRRSRLGAFPGEDTLDWA